MNVQVILQTKSGEVVCVLPTLQQAAGVTTALVVKGYGVYMKRTKEAVTHKNSAQAQSYLEVGQMELGLCHTK